MAVPKSNLMSNLSVKVKLFLGFALMIIMIMLMAYTGWKATSVLGERSERVGDISTFSTTARDMRIERLMYLIKADDEQAEKWQVALKRTEMQLQVITPNFDSKVNKDFLSEANATMKRYRGFYEQTVTATRERERLRLLAADTAEKNNDLLIKISDSGNDSTPVEWQKNITSLFIAVQKMRLNFRSYVVSPNQKTEELTRQSIQEVIKLTDGLKAYRFSKEDVEKLAQAYAKYNELVLAVIDAQANVDKAQQGITTCIGAILSISDKMTAIQNTSRLSDTTDVQRQLISWVVIATLIGLFAAWMITQSIIQPLQETLEIVDTVAKGDFTYHKTVVRRDELGTLQKNMLVMTAALRRLIGDIKDGVVQVASAAEELSAVTEQTSAGVASQKMETEQIATAMQQMTAATHEVSQNAARAVISAQATTELAVKGGQVVNQTRGQIESLALEMDTTKTAMAALRGNTDRIGGVLDVIKTVADQTNLLALNAAIEAARAGEAGRGFAVVADEVRGLAVRTRTSTDEIAQLIDELHTSTQHMSNALEQNLRLTGSSVALSREANEMLENITQSVKSIELMNEQIAVATEEQSSVGEEIAKGVTNVRDISDQTAAASEETATSSVELARISSQLQEMTHKFKI